MTDDSETGPGQAYATESVQRETGDLRQKLKELTDKYGPAAQSALQDVKKTVEQNLDDIEQQIRARPVRATLIAAGIGFLIGVIVAR